MIPFKNVRPHAVDVGVIVAPSDTAALDPADPLVAAAVESGHLVAVQGAPETTTRKNATKAEES